MALFSRFRRPSSGEVPQPPAPTALPRINQRVTVFRGSEEPVPTRVEDETDSGMVLASPNMALSSGDTITLSWEGESGWYMLETSVLEIDDVAALPTVTLGKRGRMTRFQNRRTDLRLPVNLQLDIRTGVARVVKPGRELRTHTTEVSANAIRFTTSAPFAPGDTMEVRMTLEDVEAISSRVKVIRMDSVTGSWRQTCTAVFDDILRTDRSRLAAWLETQARDHDIAPVEMAADSGTPARGIDISDVLRTEPLAPPRQRD